MTPSTISFGCVKTTLKSWALMVSPMPNMITPRKTVVYDVAHEKSEGMKNAQTESATMMTAT